METPRGDIGQREQAPDAVARMAALHIGRALSAIGRIEPWRGMTQWADLSDDLGSCLGRMSVHSQPNGESARIDVLFHLQHLRVDPSIFPMIAQCGGLQIEGQWMVGSPVRCRFTVPRDRTAALCIGRIPPVTRGEHPIITQEQREILEDVQRCLERTRGNR